ncbi:hypothetical protein V8E51_018942 [Hyaloscypha variabilis]
MLLKSVLICLTATQLAAGHGAIVKAIGDQGGTGKALGIDDTSPRDGTTRNPFQQDSARFKNAADACCETLGGGMNDPATQIPQMLAANGGQMPPDLCRRDGDDDSAPSQWAAWKSSAWCTATTLLAPAHSADAYLSRWRVRLGM